MNEFKNSVMIALLPTKSDWCKIDLPHMTLVYAGQIQDLRVTAHNELLKSAVSMALMYPRFKLNVLGPAVFGEDPDKVDVFKLAPTLDLIKMRRTVERWNASQHKDYKPHVTVGPTGSITTEPKQIEFDKILVSWGDSQTIFELL